MTEKFIFASIVAVACAFLSAVTGIKALEVSGLIVAWGIFFTLTDIKRDIEEIKAWIAAQKAEKDGK